MFFSLKIQIDLHCPTVVFSFTFNSYRIHLHDLLHVNAIFPSGTLTNIQPANYIYTTSHWYFLNITLCPYLDIVGINVIRVWWGLQNDSGMVIFEGKDNQINSINNSIKQF